MKIRKNGKVINLTESDLQRIVKRVINEEGISPTTGEKDITPPQDLPDCRSMMTNPPSGMMGGSSELEGPIEKITYNGTVSPRYQGYTVWKNGSGFCFIKR
jgi:hypothetical protein